MDLFLFYLMKATSCVLKWAFSTIVIIALFHGIAAEGLGQEGNKDTRFVSLPLTITHPTSDW